MTKDNKLKIIFGTLSAVLLITLLIKLVDVPGGMILSGFILGGMMITVLIISCFILTTIIKLILKRVSYLTVLFITLTISFLAFHYQLYSPTLIIKVPNGYTGEIDLVRANVDENILTVDSNGIGYITQWTFDKTYSKPIVEQIDGKSLDKNLVGFNPSVFFGKGNFCCIDGQEIEILSFEIVPDSVIDKKHYYSKDLINLIAKKKVLFLK